MTLPLDVRPFFTGDQLSFAATDLPQGLAIDPVTGVISGTPTTVETRAVTVTATNSAGQASQGFTWMITSGASVPGQVTGLTATPGDGVVTLSWTAPPENGAALNDYVIERSAGGSAFAPVADGVGIGTSFANSGLTNGIAHTYRVAAVNSVGTGPFSNSETATPEATGSAVSVSAYGHGQNPDSASAYTFANIALGTGTAVIGVSTRGSSGTAINVVSVGGATATPIGTPVGDANFSQVQQFFVLEGIAASTQDVVVSLNKTASRCGVHVWTLADADLGAAVPSEIFSNAASTSLAVDAVANGAVLALGTVVTPSAPELVWTGLESRQPWTDYGDTYGAGTADALFTQDVTGHQVSAAFGGLLGTVSVLVVPPL